MKSETTSTFLVLYSTEALLSTYCLLPLLSLVITAPFSQSKFSAFSLSCPFPPQSKIQFGTSMMWNQANLWEKWQKNPSPFILSHKLNTRTKYDCSIQFQKLDTKE